MEETENIKSVKLPNQEIDYLKIAKILLSRWYWIAGSVITCIIIANVYLWYTPKTYATSAMMKFEEKQTEIPGLTNTTQSVERPHYYVIQSELTVLQSTPLLLKAIRQLDYRMSFYIVGRVLNRTNELYPDKPIDVQLVKFDSLNFFHQIVTFRPVDENTFKISYKSGSKDVDGIYRYGVPFTLGPTSFSIKYPGKLPSTTAYLFKLNSAEDFLGRVSGGLHTGETGRGSDIISLQEIDSNPRFAADILNAIMKEYLIYDRDQRTQSASQQIQFIDSQLDFLAGEVKGSENSIKKYKQQNKIMDVSTASEEVVGKARDIESQKSTLKIQLLALNQFKQDIIKSKSGENFTSEASGITDRGLGQFAASYNALEAERNTLLKTYITKSQPIKDIDQQILQLKNNAINGVDGEMRMIQNKISYLNQQLTLVNKQIEELPVAERDLAGLQRDFEINDKVYSFLSEKKLDAQISSAGILPGASIVDMAQPNFSPVTPDQRGIRRNAILFGLIIGLGAIILIRVLNPYIYDKETIESLTTIPIIGVIRKYPDDIDEYSSQILALRKPKSMFAESVRSVRTNLSFIASEKKSKVICITSEVAGEGKSFVAVNLSSTLSLIDKKIILVGADLRRSKLHKTFNVPNGTGLSSYLAHQCEAEDIVKHSAYNNLDYIISGPVPPNPSELLHSKRMTELIDMLKEQYDIVMIDTAPIGLVSDSIPLVRISDVNVFVIRSGKSKYYAATVPQRIAQEYQLDNTVIVLNAYSEDLLHSRYYTTKFTGENYGSRFYYYSDYSGYESSGYYVDEHRRKWWDIRRLFNR